MTETALSEYRENNVYIIFQITV